MRIYLFNINLNYLSLVVNQQIGQQLNERMLKDKNALKKQNEMLMNMDRIRVKEKKLEECH